MHTSQNLKHESAQTLSGSTAPGTNRLWVTLNALEQTQLAVVISDAASIIQYVNQGFTRMMGYSSGEVIGRSISDFSRHFAGDMKDVQKTLASGGTWRDEFPVTCKDGSTVWIYNVVSPIRDDDGVITNYVGIGEDISAVMQVDEGLRRREDRYRLLVEKAQDVVYTTDSRGYFDYINPRAFELTGYTQEELVDKRFVVLVHPDWQDRVEQFYQQQYDDRTPETLYEFPIVTKTGRMKWIEQTVVLVAHENGTVSFQAIVRDVTRRKQAETEAQALARENAVIAEITRIISSSLDIGEVYDAFAAEVNKLINFDRMVILLIDHQKGVYTVAHGSGVVPAGRELGAELALEGSFTALISERKASVIIDAHDVWQQGGELHSASAPILDSGIRTSMGFPLISRGEVIGVMILDSLSSDAFTQHHRDLGDLLARNIVGVIVNAQMHAQIQKEAEERADVRERMATIGRIISGSLDIDEVYESFIEQVNGLIPSDRIVVLTLDRNQSWAETAYVWGTVLTDFQPGDAQPVHDTVLQEIIDTRKGLIRVDEPLERIKSPTLSQIAGLSQGLRSLVAAPLISGDEVIGALVLRSRTPSAYGPRDLGLAELIAAQIAGAVANAQMHRQIQREAEERAALAEIGRIIDSSIDIEDVYQRFVEVVNRLIPSDRIAVALLNAQGDAVINSYVWGAQIEDRGIGGATPVEGTPVGAVVKTRRALVVRAQSPEEFIAQFPRQAARFSADLRSMIVAPMMSEDRVIGAFVLKSTNLNAYGTRDKELAERIAAQISGAVANSLLFSARQKAERMLEQINEELESKVDARTRELSEANDSLQSSQDQLRALAARMEMIREEERTHISHEIHDEIGQALTGLKFDISWIRRRMAGVEDADLRDAVDQRISSIFADIDRNIELVRNLSTQLRPAALDNFGLSAAIESEVQEFQERTGIRCEVSTPDAEVDIGKDAALGVFRILQEAMTNAARHAMPTSITVNLKQDSRYIVLQVRDDGKGMAGISDTSSLGLLGMKERARLMGGDLRIESALNRGTTVRLRAPIQGPAIQHK